MVRMDGWFWIEVARRNPGRLTVLSLILFTEIRKRFASSDSEGSVSRQERVGRPGGSQNDAPRDSDGRVSRQERVGRPGGDKSDARS